MRCRSLFPHVSSPQACCKQARSANAFLNEFHLHSSTFAHSGFFRLSSHTVLNYLELLLVILRMVRATWARTTGSNCKLQEPRADGKLGPEYLICRCTFSSSPVKFWMNFVNVGIQCHPQAFLLSVCCHDAMPNLSWCSQDLGSSCGVAAQAI